MPYVEVDPSQSGADSWKLEPVVDLLKQVAVGVIPTDTVYALVCGLRNNSAIKRLRRIKNIDPLKPLASYATPSTTLIHIRQGFPAVMAKVLAAYGILAYNSEASHSGAGGLHEHNCLLVMKGTMK